MSEVGNKNSEDLLKCKIDWVYQVYHAKGHEYLYKGFETLLYKFKSSNLENEKKRVLIRQLLEILCLEIRDVVYYQDHKDIVWPHRLTVYNQYRFWDFIYDYGEKSYHLREPWRKYIERCYFLITKIIEEDLLGVNINTFSLTEKESFAITSPLHYLYLHGGRGLWDGEIVLHLDDRKISEIIRNLGYVLPNNEKRLLDIKDYPPDESMFSHQDDIVFTNLLIGLSKNPIPDNLRVLEKFLDDEETWVRQLAIKLMVIS